MQRVAIARAIVNKPMVLLLDDRWARSIEMRKEMQVELKKCSAVWASRSSM
jgi:ABC-type Fe3+/spermidine/putrescine transport system ATPase subunit